jgi:hypothetical protein
VAPFGFAAVGFFAIITAFGFAVTGADLKFIQQKIHGRRQFKNCRRPFLI